MIERRARLRPDLADIQQKAAVSRNLFSNDENYGRNGCWARMPNGKIYASLKSRIVFIANEKKGQGLNPTDIDGVKDAEKAFLDVTNSQAHPTSVGGEGILFIGIIIYLAAHHTYNTLVASKIGTDEALYLPFELDKDPMLEYLPEHSHIAPLWSRVEELFRTITDMAAKWRTEARDTS